VRNSEHIFQLHIFMGTDVNVVYIKGSVGLYSRREFHSSACVFMLPQCQVKEEVKFSLDSTQQLRLG
jgi:hypothetical protein